jgi:ribose transport system substrate-binding protein
MKKAMFIALLLVFVTGLLIAGGATDKQAAGGNIKKTYEVVWLAPMEHVFWYYLRQGMEQQAAKVLEEKGWKINITQMAPVEAYNISEQTAQFESVISKKVDAVMICPVNEEAIIPVVKKAYKAKIPVVSVSAVIPADEILTITQPYEVETTKNIAKYAIDHNGKTGDAIILFGMEGNITSNDRLQGHNEAIKESSGVRLLDTQPVQFNKEKSMSVMENMLTKYPTVKFVFGVNDDAALGAYEAAAAAGRQKGIVITGFDGTIDGLKSILAGKVYATAWKDPFRIGRDSIAALAKYWSGDKVGKEDYRYNCEIVTKDNAQTYIDMYAQMEKWYKTK